MLGVGDPTLTIVTAVSVFDLFAVNDQTKLSYRFVSLPGSTHSISPAKCVCLQTLYQICRPELQDSGRVLKLKHRRTIP